MVADGLGLDEEQVFDNAQQVGREVFESYFMNNIITSFDGTISFNNPSDNVIKAYVGATSQYSDFLSFSKLVGGKVPMSFKTESFLGKEVTRIECGKRVCDALKASVGTCTTHVTLFDNGC